MNSIPFNNTEPVKNLTFNVEDIRDIQIFTRELYKKNYNKSDTVVFSIASTKNEISESKIEDLKLI